MELVASFLAALSLSMDNLAVTITAGACAPEQMTARLMLRVSVLFAVSHFVMFGAGFWGGEELARFLGPVALWAACAALGYIGAEMIHEGLHREEHDRPIVLSSLRKQLFLAVATSTDALVVGAGFGMASTAFWPMTLMLVACVLVTSLVGFGLGNLLGRKFGRYMEIAGGAVLIGLGVKLLLETQGIL